MVTETDAKAISQGVGETMRGFAASIVAPIYWASRDADDSVIARNGTAFFLRTSAALIGVTAAHVIEGKKGWRQHCLKHGKTALRLWRENTVRRSRSIGMLAVSKSIYKCESLI